MKNFSVGDVFYGKSYVDMINKALGTNIHEGFMYSCVKLDNFGYRDVVAWFAFMNGERHGHRVDWLWKNYLLDEGTKIQEKLVSTQTSLYDRKRNEEGFFPYRVCFQIDPYQTENRYCCKFVGVFRLTNFLKSNLTAMEYTKVADEFVLRNISEYEYDEKVKKPLVESYKKYKTPIENLGFSDHVYKILKSGNINYAHELLEIGLNSNNDKFLNELKEKLYTLFKGNNGADEKPSTLATEKPSVVIKTTNSAESRYLLKNKIYSGDAIVLEAVTEYVKAHITIGVQELKSVFNFPCFSFNVIEDSICLAKNPLDRLNYFCDEDKSLPLVDGDAYVFKKWDSANITKFINAIKPLGLNIEII